MGMIVSFKGVPVDGELHGRSLGQAAELLQRAWDQAIAGGYRPERLILTPDGAEAIVVITLPGAVRDLKVDVKIGP